MTSQLLLLRYVLQLHCNQPINISMPLHWHLVIVLASEGSDSQFDAQSQQQRIRVATAQGKQENWMLTSRQGKHWEFS